MAATDPKLLQYQALVIKNQAQAIADEATKLIPLLLDKDKAAAQAILATATSLAKAADVLSTSVVTPVTPPPPPVDPPPVDPPPATGRVAVKWPYASGSWVNRRLDKNKAVYGGSAGIGSGTVNAGAWSHAIYYATASDPLVTISGPWGSVQIHLPTNTKPPTGSDGATAIVQPDGRYCHGFYAFDATNHTGQTHVVDDLWGNAYNVGWFSTTLTGTMSGLFLKDELKAGVFPHALRLGLPTDVLSNFFQWPAANKDGATPQGQGANTGHVNYGARLAIKPGVDLSKLGLSKTGLGAAKAAQDYGVIVVERAGQPVLMAESRTEGMAEVNELRADVPKIFSQLVIVTNGSNGTPGTGDGGCLAAADAPVIIG